MERQTVAYSASIAGPAECPVFRGRGIPRNTGHSPSPLRSSHDGQFLTVPGQLPIPIVKRVESFETLGNCTGIKGNHAAIYLWRKGYEEALRVLDPILIIRYGDKMSGEREDISHHILMSGLTPNLIHWPIPYRTTPKYIAWTIHIIKPLFIDTFLIPRNGEHIVAVTSCCIIIRITPYIITAGR